MVHPSGSGAFGYFECTKDMSEFTKAGLFSSAGKKTPVFLRYSTVTFGREFPDSGRNPRGFAIKHYTEDGNYDVVGLSWVSFLFQKVLHRTLTSYRSPSSSVVTLFKDPMSFDPNLATLKTSCSITTLSSTSSPTYQRLSMPV